MLEFKLPEIGENITSGTVTNFMVAAGDAVRKGQDLVELETEKASLPVPSPCDGIIKEVLVKEGDDVKIGAVIFKIEETSPCASTPQPKSGPKPAVQRPQPQRAPAPQPVRAARSEERRVGKEGR